jgi:CBS domain-containing protein
MKPFESLTAEDLMSSPVVALNVDTSLAEAARTLTEQEISGALVTDHRDATVGVVSLFDIVTHMAGFARSPEQSGGFYRYSYPAFAEAGEGWEPEEEEAEPVPIGETTVGEIMTTEIIEVPPSLPAKEVAKQLAEKHIHRIFVSGKNGPIGVISTMDLLRSIAGVAQAHAPG